MARYEVTEKVTTSVGHKRFYEISNIPLVSPYINPTGPVYGDSNYTWNPISTDTDVYENRTFLMHKISSKAHITYHDIQIFGHETTPTQDTDLNSFYVSNCYYLTNFGAGFKHHQYLSPELLIDTMASYKYNHFHLFPEPGAGQTTSRIGNFPRYRALNYNDMPYESTPRTYSAPYVFTSMHHQHLPLCQRFLQDCPNEVCPPEFYLALRVYGTNIESRPLVLSSRIEWFI